MSLRDTVSKRQAERQNGKPAKKRTLAAMRAAKDAPKRDLAALRAEREQRTKSSKKLDFNRDGFFYHNVQQHGMFWTIDVSNGDQTITFHNRRGTWLADWPGNMLKEPRTPSILAGIFTRWHLELHARGLMTPEEEYRKRQESDAMVRRQQRRKEAS